MQPSGSQKEETRQSQRDSLLALRPNQLADESDPEDPAPLPESLLTPGHIHDLNRRIRKYEAQIHDAFIEELRANSVSPLSNGESKDKGFKIQAVSSAIDDLALPELGSDLHGAELHNEMVLAAHHRRLESIRGESPYDHRTMAFSPRFYSSAGHLLTEDDRHLATLHRTSRDHHRSASASSTQESDSSDLDDDEFTSRNRSSPSGPHRKVQRVPESNELDSQWLLQSLAFGREASPPRQSIIDSTPEHREHGRPQYDSASSTLSSLNFQSPPPGSLHYANSQTPGRAGSQSTHADSTNYYATLLRNDQALKLGPLLTGEGLMAPSPKPWNDADLSGAARETSETQDSTEWTASATGSLEGPSVNLDKGDKKDALIAHADFPAPAQQNDCGSTCQDAQAASLTARTFQDNASDQRIARNDANVDTAMYENPPSSTAPSLGLYPQSGALDTSLPDPELVSTLPLAKRIPELNLGETAQEWSGDVRTESGTTDRVSPRSKSVASQSVSKLKKNVAERRRKNSQPTSTPTYPSESSNAPPLSKHNESGQPAQEQDITLHLRPEPAPPNQLQLLSSRSIQVPEASDSWEKQSSASNVDWRRRQATYEESPYQASRFRRLHEALRINAVIGRIGTKMSHFAEYGSPDLTLWHLIDELEEEKARISGLPEQTDELEALTNPPSLVTQRLGLGIQQEFKAKQTTEDSRPTSGAAKSSLDNGPEMESGSLEHVSQHFKVPPHLWLNPWMAQGSDPSPLDPVEFERSLALEAAHKSRLRKQTMLDYEVSYELSRRSGSKYVSAPIERQHVKEQLRREKRERENRRAMVVALYDNLTVPSSRSVVGSDAPTAAKSSLQRARRRSLARGTINVGDELLGQLNDLANSADRSPMQQPEDYGDLALEARDEYDWSLDPYSKPRRIRDVLDSDDESEDGNQKAGVYTHDASDTPRSRHAQIVRELRKLELDGLDKAEATLNEQALDRMWQDYTTGYGYVAGEPSIYPFMSFREKRRQPSAEQTEEERRHIQEELFRDRELLRAQAQLWKSGNPLSGNGSATLAGRALALTQAAVSARVHDYAEAKEREREARNRASTRSPGGGTDAPTSPSQAELDSNDPFSEQFLKRLQLGCSSSASSSDGTITGTSVREELPGLAGLTATEVVSLAHKYARIAETRLPFEEDSHAGFSAPASESAERDHSSQGVSTRVPTMPPILSQGDPEFDRDETLLTERQALATNPFIARRIRRFWWIFFGPPPKPMTPGPGVGTALYLNQAPSSPQADAMRRARRQSYLDTIETDVEGTLNDPVLRDLGLLMRLHSTHEAEVEIFWDTVLDRKFDLPSASRSATQSPSSPASRSDLEFRAPDSPYERIARLHQLDLKWPPAIIHRLTFARYETLHLCITRALLGPATWTPELGKMLAKEDWLRDLAQDPCPNAGMRYSPSRRDLSRSPLPRSESGGTEDEDEFDALYNSPETLSYEGWARGMFELVDRWTDSTITAEYCTFLETLLARVVICAIVNRADERATSMRAIKSRLAAPTPHRGSLRSLRTPGSTPPVSSPSTPEPQRAKTGSSDGASVGTGASDPALSKGVVEKPPEPLLSIQERARAARTISVQLNRLGLLATDNLLDRNFTDHDEIEISNRVDALIEATDIILAANYEPSEGHSLPEQDTQEASRQGQAIMKYGGVDPTEHHQPHPLSASPVTSTAPIPNVRILRHGHKYSTVSSGWNSRTKLSPMPEEEEDQVPMPSHEVTKDEASPRSHSSPKLEAGRKSPKSPATSSRALKKASTHKGAKSAHNSPTLSPWLERLPDSAHNVSPLSLVNTSHDLRPDETLTPEIASDPGKSDKEKYSGESSDSQASARAFVNSLLAQLNANIQNKPNYLLTPAGQQRFEQLLALANLLFTIAPRSPKSKQQEHEGTLIERSSERSPKDSGHQSIDILPTHTTSVPASLLENGEDDGGVTLNPQDGEPSLAGLHSEKGPAIDNECLLVQRYDDRTCAVGDVLLHQPTVVIRSLDLVHENGNTEYVEDVANPRSEVHLDSVDPMGISPSGTRPHTPDPNRQLENLRPSSGTRHVLHERVSGRSASMQLDHQEVKFRKGASHGGLGLDSGHVNDATSSGFLTISAIPIGMQGKRGASDLPPRIEGSQGSDLSSLESDGGRGTALRGHSARGTRVHDRASASTMSLSTVTANTEDGPPTERSKVVLKEVLSLAPNIEDIPGLPGRIARRVQSLTSLSESSAQAQREMCAKVFEAFAKIHASLPERSQLHGLAPFQSFQTSYRAIHRGDVKSAQNMYRTLQIDHILQFFRLLANALREDDPWRYDACLAELSKMLEHFTEDGRPKFRLSENDETMRDTGTWGIEFTIKEGSGPDELVQLWKTRVIKAGETASDTGKSGLQSSSMAWLARLDSNSEAVEKVDDDLSQITEQILATESAVQAAETSSNARRAHLTLKRMAEIIRAHERFLYSDPLKSSAVPGTRTEKGSVLDQEMPSVRFNRTYSRKEFAWLRDVTNTSRQLIHPGSTGGHAPKHALNDPIFLQLPLNSQFRADVERVSPEVVAQQVLEEAAPDQHERELLSTLVSRSQDPNSCSLIRERGRASTLRRLRSALTWHRLVQLESKLNPNGPAKIHYLSNDIALGIGQGRYPVPQPMVQEDPEVESIVPTTPDSAPNIVLDPVLMHVPRVRIPGLVSTRTLGPNSEPPSAKYWQLRTMPLREPMNLPRLDVQPTQMKDPSKTSSMALTKPSKLSPLLAAHPRASRYQELIGRLENRLQRTMILLARRLVPTISKVMTAARQLANQQCCPTNYFPELSKRIRKWIEDSPTLSGNFDKMRERFGDSRLSKVPGVAATLQRMRTSIRELEWQADRAEKEIRLLRSDLKPSSNQDDKSQSVTTAMENLALLFVIIGTVWHKIATEAMLRASEDHLFRFVYASIARDGDEKRDDMRPDVPGLRDSRNEDTADQEQVSFIERAVSLARRVATLSSQAASLRPFDHHVLMPVQSSDEAFKHELAELYTLLLGDCSNSDEASDVKAIILALVKPAIKLVLAFDSFLTVQCVERERHSNKAELGKSKRMDISSRLGEALVRVRAAFSRFVYVVYCRPSVEPSVGVKRVARTMASELIKAISGPRHVLSDGVDGSLLARITPIISASVPLHKPFVNRIQDLPTHLMHYFHVLVTNSAHLALHECQNEIARSQAGLRVIEKASQPRNQGVKGAISLRATAVAAADALANSGDPSALHHSSEALAAFHTARVIPPPMSAPTSEVTILRAAELSVHHELVPIQKAHARSILERASTQRPETKRQRPECGSDPSKLLEESISLSRVAEETEVAKSSIVPPLSLSRIVDVANEARVSRSARIERKASDPHSRPVTSQSARSSASRTTVDRKPHIIRGTTLSRIPTQGVLANKPISRQTRPRYFATETLLHQALSQHSERRHERKDRWSETPRAETAGDNATAGQIRLPDIAKGVFVPRLLSDHVRDVISDVDRSVALEQERGVPRTAPSNGKIQDRTPTRALFPRTSPHPSLPRGNQAGIGVQSSAVGFQTVRWRPRTTDLPPAATVGSSFLDDDAHEFDEATKDPEKLQRLLQPASDAASHLPPHIVRWMANDLGFDHLKNTGMAGTAADIPSPGQESQSNLVSKIPHETKTAKSRSQASVLRARAEWLRTHRDTDQVYQTKRSKMFKGWQDVTDRQYLHNRSIDVPVVSEHKVEAALRARTTQRLD